MNRLAPSRLFHRLRHIRVENKGLKLLSLLLAVLLFALSRQPTTDLRLVGVPIEYRVSPGFEIGGDTERTVSVRVNGPRNVIRSLTPNQLLIIADLNNKEPGERLVQLRADKSLLPDDVKILQIEPVSIRIKLEPTATKRVKVEPQLLGQAAKGWEIRQVKLVPDEVEIEGPQSLIDKIDHVVTETVNLKGRNSSFQTSVEAEALQNSLRIKTPGPIALSVDIGEERVSRRLTNIPVQWVDKSANGRLLTKTVEIEVYGPKSLVESIRPDEARVEVTTTGLSLETTSLTPQIHFPTQIEQHIEVKSVVPREVKVKR
jgi:YbbR domain-containing protein